MNQASKYTTLRDYLRVVRERRRLIVLVLLFSAGAALAYSLRQEPVYKADAAISFQTDSEGFNDIGALQPVTESPEQRAAIKSESLLDVELAERAKKELRTRLEPGDLLSRVTTAPETRTHFVIVSATSNNPKFAAKLANAFADAAVERETEEVRRRYRQRAKVVAEQNRRLRDNEANQYTRAANSDRINRLRSVAEFATPAVLARPARTPATPESPKPVRNTIFGALVGLTLGMVLAFVRDALDRRLKSVREIRDELHLPLVGHVRDDVLGRPLATKGVIAFSDQELEAFKILRTNVEFLDVDSAGPTIVVTSPLPSEGKSTVASALAAAYAAAGRRVLLVECDLRRPTLAQRYGLKSTPGLSDYLIDGAGPQEVLQTIPLAPVRNAVNGTPIDSGRSDGAKPLVCITAGTPLPQPAELLGSKRFAAFLEQVAGVYDTVILDTAPLLSVVDTLELVPMVDRVVLCVRASQTTRDQARAAKAALEHFPARPTGVVVTGVRSGDEEDYGYYSYAYAYGRRD